MILGMSTTQELHMIVHGWDKAAAPTIKCSATWLSGEIMNFVRTTVRILQEVWECISLPAVPMQAAEGRDNQTKSSPSTSSALLEETAPAVLVTLV